MKHQLYQLVVFIPASHLEKVKNALFDAGAGSYHNYERCSFQSPGTGQFRPGNGSSPHTGSIGELEQVDEYRVEMLCKENNLENIRNALLMSHPYEEPAYHFIPIVI